MTFELRRLDQVDDAKESVFLFSVEFEVVEKGKVSGRVTSTGDELTGWISFEISSNDSNLFKTCIGFALEAIKPFGWVQVSVRFDRNEYVLADALKEFGFYRCASSWEGVTMGKDCNPFALAMASKRVILNHLHWRNRESIYLPNCLKRFLFEIDEPDINEKE